MLRIVIILVLSVFPGYGPVWAQDAGESSTQRMLDQSREAIERAEKQSIERPDFTAADRAAKEAMRRSRQVLEQVGSGRSALPALPEVDLMRLPQLSVDPLNMDRLARQGQELYRSIEEQGERYPHRVLVFVSSSMPTETLRRYLDQAAAIQAAVVFRGFKGGTLASMKGFVAELLRPRIEQARSSQPQDATVSLRGAEPSILIDPTLFRRFQIQAVPVIVATEQPIQGCPGAEVACPAPPHHAVRGDVDLGWALGQISRKAASEALRERLGPWVKRLRG